MSESSNDASHLQRDKVNSAKRLHDTLLRIRSTEGVNLFAVLPAALDITKTLNIVDPPQMAIEAFALMGAMLADVRREIEQSSMSSEDQDFYHQSFPGIYSALSPGYCIQAWSEGRKKFRDVNLTSLTHLDRVLRHHVREQKVEEADFKTLLTAVEQALGVLKSSQLPDQLADFIKHQLLRVQHAVNQYKYRGMPGVQEALAGYMGALGMAQPAINEKLDEHGKANLIEVLKTGNALITLAHGATWAWPHIVSLVESAAKLLP
jgi:hypothetical protein